MNDLAKVTRDGRTQIVALPEQFALEGDAVRVRRDGRNLVLEPVEEAGDWIDAISGTLDEDFARLALERPGPDSYERPDINLD